MANAPKDRMRDRQYKAQGVSYLDSDPMVGFRLGHEVWKEITSAQEVYFPETKDLYLELYADFKTFSQDPERYRRYGIRPEQTYFTGDGDVEAVDGYPRPDLWDDGDTLGSDQPGFDFNRNTVDRTIVSGSASTTVGTRFWFEIQGPDASEAVANLDPIRIPAPESLRSEIQEFADEQGAEITRVKGAVFEERFDLGGAPERGPGHQDFHLKYENATSRQEVLEVMSGALDLTERAVRTV